MDKRYFDKNHNSKNDFEKTNKWPINSGFSVTELVIGAAIFGFLALVLLRFSDFSLDQVADNSRRQDGAEKISVLTNDLRKQFRYKTRVDTVTGTVLDDGLFYDAVNEPGTFLIRTRNRDLTKISAFQYATVCQANPVKDIAYTPPPSTFCPGVTLPTCNSDQRHAIQVTSYKDYTGSASTANAIRSIPSARERSLENIYAAAMCIREASSNKLRLRVALGSQNRDRIYKWRYEDVEIWEDIGTTGIEFLN